VGRKVVKFSGLKVERFGDKADLNFGAGVLLLPKESQKSAKMKGGGVANDGSVGGQLGDFAGVGDGVCEVTGGIDQIQLESSFTGNDPTIGNLTRQFLVGKITFGSDNGGESFEGFGNHFLDQLLLRFGSGSSWIE
jgi:hypothetical protein